MKMRRVWGWALGLGSGAGAWQVDVLYRMPEARLVGEAGRGDTAWYFDTVAALGKYGRTSVAVREGGWSGLEVDSADPTGSSFWTVSEGGLAVSRESGGRNDRLVAFPGYHQKLAHVVLRDGVLAVDRLDSIASWGNPSVYTNGLRNTLSSSDAAMLRMDLVTGGNVALDTLPASADGYDLEAVRYRAGAFWLADESGPFLLKVNAATHRIDKQWAPDNGLPKVFARRRANRGFEAMATTPAGLVAAIVQSPMLNAQGSVDNSTTRDSRVMRLVVLDPATGAVREHVVLNDQKPNAVGPTRKGRDCKIGDMVALDENRFVLVEHGADVAGKYWIDLWEIDLSQATNVTATNKIGMTFAGGTLTLEQLGDSATLAANGIVPAAKRLVRGDLMATTPWVSQQPEGLGVVDDTTVALLSDDDHGCREMDSAGAVDGICHIQKDALSRSVLMYLKVPSLAPGGAGVSRRGRSDLALRAVPGGVRVAWGAGSGRLHVELRDPAGRGIGGGDVVADRPGERIFPLPPRHGLVAVRITGSGEERSAIVAPRP